MRCYNLARRYPLWSEPVEGDFQVGYWLVQPKLNCISGNGKTSHLEPKAMQVLAYLAEHTGDVMPKERIIQAVWADTFVTDDVLTRAVSELRHVFEDNPHEPHFIQTIPKGGYRLIATVGPAAAVSPPAISAARTPPLQRWILVVAALILIVLAGLGVYLVRQRLARPEKARAGKVMLVVLPFDNLSGDPEQEYFSDGITEEMTAQLARLRPERLAVIGRASAMTYKGRKKTIDEIGRELRVQYVLEGSVRRAGDRVRITAQLVEVGDQAHVWAQTYDRDLRNILELQANVARDIAREIKVKLAPGAPVGLASLRPANPEAHELYLKGRYFWNQRTPEGFAKAIAYLKEAIQKDPDYAPAYAGLADAYIMEQIYLGTKPQESYPRARDAAARALQIDPELGEAYASLADVELFYDWDWEAAERDFRRAIELNPSYATAHHWYAVFLFYMRRFPEALKEARRTEELDPLSPIIAADFAGMLYYARLYEQGIQQAHKALELYPGFFKAHRILSFLYFHAGRPEEAVGEYLKANALWGTPPEETAELKKAYESAGLNGFWRMVLRQKLRHSNGDDNSPYFTASLYARLNEPDQAIAWLEKAYADRVPMFPRMRVDPDFDSLRSDARFQDLVRRMNFPP